MQVFNILLDVVGPVFLVALVGYTWAKRGHPFDAAFVSLLVVGVCTPALIIDTLTTAGLKPAALGVMALGAVLCHLLALGLGWLVIRGLKLPTRVYLPCIAFANTGNMGIPLALFAFGEKGMGLAIAYFAIGTLANFTIGQAIAMEGASFGTLIKMPLIWAVIISIILGATGIALPSVVARTVHLIGGITVPLMLISLGVSIARLKVAKLNRSLLIASVRLLGGYAIGWLVASMLGLTGIERGVLIIQSAMPSAVYNYMFAVRHGNDPEEVAGVVVVSALLSAVLLPIFIVFLI